MTTITSKRHLFKFYFSIILVTVLFLALGTGLLFMFKGEIDKGGMKPKDMLLPLMSILCYLFAGYGLYCYIRNSPSIKLDNENISFNRQIFSLTDIERVELTGKRPFKYAFSYPLEAATIIFKNGDKKYIFDDMYSNSWEIKTFLKHVVIDRKDLLVPTKHLKEVDSWDNEFYESYKGTVITSLRGISLWGLIGFLCFMLLSDKKLLKAWMIIFYIMLSAFWFLIHSYLMNYFQVSQNFFVVRNHNLFWRKNIYRIADINEVVFETRGKMPNCLRVITKDFRTRLYPAATLRDRKWLELKDKLESYGIEVRNECI